jgi:NitT/TauT family transport system substrate-binding protein
MGRREMSRLRRAFALATLLALLPLHANVQTLPAIRVLNLGGDGGSLGAYALDGGFFKKYGLDATVAGTSSGGAVVAAVVGGSAEIGFSNLMSVAAALGRGIPITIIAPSTVFTSKAPDIVLAKGRHSPLRSGADLNGKIVAVTTLDGEQQLGAEVWVDKTGGNSKSVRFVELPETSMAASLVQGRIDAAMMTGSYFGQARNEVELLGNADAAIAPIYISGVYFAATSWVDAHPDGARRAAQALRETAHWVNTHHAETAPILQRITGLDAPSVAAMVRSTFAESLTVSEIQPVLDAGLAYGRLKVPLDTRAIVAKALIYWGK